MIGRPFVNVRCDGKQEDGDACRRAEVFSLPAFIVDVDQVGRLFLTLQVEWRQRGALMLCPQCGRIAEAQARAAAVVSQGGLQ